MFMILVGHSRRDIAWEFLGQGMVGAIHFTYSNIFYGQGFGCWSKDATAAQGIGLLLLPFAFRLLPFAFYLLMEPGTGMLKKNDIFTT